MEYPSGVGALLANAAYSGFDKKASGVSGDDTDPLPAGCGAQFPSLLTSWLLAAMSGAFVAPSCCCKL